MLITQRGGGKDIAQKGKGDTTKTQKNYKQQDNDTILGAIQRTKQPRNGRVGAE